MSAAARSWHQTPDRSFGRLERARSVNFLSEEPDLIAGAIAKRLGDRSRARAAFSRAVERTPANWYPHLELAVLAASTEDFGTASRHLAVARRLNPREPVIRLVDASVRDRSGIDPLIVDRIFSERVATFVR